MPKLFNIFQMTNGQYCILLVSEQSHCSVIISVTGSFGPVAIEINIIIE